MGPYIESAKRQAHTIMTTLKEEHPDSNFLFGAVFYRDFEDTPRFYIVPFKEDIAHDIQHVEACGGNDIPEDVAGGYQQILDMDWKHADAKFCFHIADAPPHGILWHAQDIPDMHTTLVGRPLEDIIDDMHRHDIRLSIVRVNATLDIMIHNFRRIYGDALNVMNLDHTAPTDTLFTETITRHISSTLSLMD